MRPSLDQLEPLLVAPTGTRDDLAAEAAGAALATVEQQLFSMAIVHELKKAILSIAVDAQRLEAESRACPKASATVSSIIRTATQADQVLQRLLDTASIEAGRLELRQTRVDLGKLVRDAIDGLPPGQRARIELELVDRMAAMIDPVRFARCLATLIDGALDHARSTTHVAIRLESHGTDRARISMTGVEIAGFAQELAWAFATADVTRLHHGVAFALRTVLTVIEAHGGAIGFEPEVGGAPRVCIEIPAIQLRGMLARRQGRSGGAGDDTLDDDA